MLLSKWDSTELPCYQNGTYLKCPVIKTGLNLAILLSNWESTQLSCYQNGTQLVRTPKFWESTLQHRIQLNKRNTISL